MSTTIQIKRSVTTGHTPSLQPGEIAVNLPDKLLFIGNTSGGYFSFSTVSTPAGSNTQVQFNDSGALGASSGLTYDKVNFNLSVSNNVFVGANVTLSTTLLFIGNSTANSTYTSALVSLANSSGTANLQPTQLVIGASLVNSSIAKATTLQGVGGNTGNRPTGSNGMYRYNTDTGFNEIYTFAGWGVLNMGVGIDYGSVTDASITNAFDFGGVP